MDVSVGAAMTRVRHVASILGWTARNFISDYCFRHSAALSFYTLFSLAPMVLISVHVASLFAAEVDFERELVQQFTELVGAQGAEGISVLLANLQSEESTRLRLLAGGLVLLFSATNIFVQLQDAFNEIFSVKASGTGWLKRVLDRLISLGIILSLGLIMTLSLVIDSSVVLLQNWLVASFPDLAVYFISLIQYLVLALLATLEIYALLHFLPDVHLPRQYKLRGCAVIIVLLVIGKSVISWYIGTSRFSELGGAAASVIVLMLWIYYSSLIVFLGAEVIKSMAIVDKVTLRPKRYAVKVRSVVVAADEATARQPARPETTLPDAGEPADSSTTASAAMAAAGGDVAVGSDGYGQRDYRAAEHSGTATALQEHDVQESASQDSLPEENLPEENLPEENLPEERAGRRNDPAAPPD